METPTEPARVAPEYASSPNAPVPGDDLEEAASGRPQGGPGLRGGVSRQFLLHHRLCPLGIDADGVLEVAVGPDSIAEGLDDMAVAYDAEVSTVEYDARALSMAIERLTSTGVSGGDVPLGEAADENEADGRTLAAQPPVVRFVNLLLREAYEAGVSDVHLDARRERTEVRFRRDGILEPALDPPRGLEAAIVSRLKVLAELDIAERRRPQDGRIRVRLEERDLDVRVSTVPTMFGESVVLRLLDRGGRRVTLSDLGLGPAIRSSLQALATRAHGLMLATGPTGSGKTTTLYAGLGLRDAAREKVVTIEEPIEYALPGVTQVPVHRQAGVTSASALRSILRQDPDVVMVGEMRDPETAELAVQAALTGHLVFSTLHTNDALGAVPRLLDLGVPRYLVAATLDGVLAQRLVRTICEGCREGYRPTDESLGILRNAVPEDRIDGVPPEFARGSGCARCRGSGYDGRIGLFELLRVDAGVRDALAAGAPLERIRTLARSAGWVPLAADGWEKACAGVTTVEEVLRVTRR